jgi:hypothetical protein
MPLMSKPSSAPHYALFYITTGSLLTVWSSVWYLMNRPETRIGQFICTGLFFTGIVLLVIGFAIGQIGRAARAAELPPKEVTAAEAQKDQTAAARGAVPPAGSPPPVPTPNQVSTASPNG